ncbi:hypothetical protein MBLNU230_g8219t1 [Neophaeotheca triangularis]
MPLRNYAAAAAFVGLAAAAPAPQGNYQDNRPENAYSILSNAYESFTDVTASYNWPAQSSTAAAGADSTVTGEAPAATTADGAPTGVASFPTDDNTAQSFAIQTPVSGAANVDYQYQDYTGYKNADAPYTEYAPEYTNVATTFGPDSTIPYSSVSTPDAGEQRSSMPTGRTSHGPFSGEATTTGAVHTDVLGTGIEAMPPNPTATYYNTDGKLTEPQPIPYMPAGGLGTNGSEPRYMVESDFDYESIMLGLYQEWIELDSFNNIVAIFSDEEFAAAGLTPEDKSLLQFMAQQEQGHATLLTNMLGETAAPQCTYNYPYTTVREAVDFLQILTRYGESGVWGFINHLDSREVGQLLAQSIATEARQEMIFRQMSGLHPMPVWFEAGIPQSWAWTYLAPYISSCPENTTRLAWQNFPALHVVNQANINRFSPNDTADFERVGNRSSDPGVSTIPQDQQCLPLNTTGYACDPTIATNRSEPLTFPGKQIRFIWDSPGVPVGPNLSYVTDSTAGEPRFVAWANQLNLTYTPLTVTGQNEGYTYQPAGSVYEGGQGIVNDTMFVALTDSDPYLTPFNLSMINPHVAALGIFQAG